MGKGKKVKGVKGCQSPLNMFKGCSQVHHMGSESFHERDGSNIVGTQRPEILVKYIYDTCLVSMVVSQDSKWYKNTIYTYLSES